MTVLLLTAIYSAMHGLTVICSPPHKEYFDEHPTVSVRYVS